MCRKKQKKFAISSSQRKIILFGSDRKKAEPGNFISGSSYNVFFIVIKILKVIFEPVRSWYGDGEKFNSDWTYTKSYGGPHFAGDKLFVYWIKKLHLKLDTYFSKLNLKTPPSMYHFCLYLSKSSFFSKSVKINCYYKRL